MTRDPVTFYILMHWWNLWAHNSRRHACSHL